MGQIHLVSSFFISWPLPLASCNQTLTSFKSLKIISYTLQRFPSVPLPLLGYVVATCQLYQVSDLLLQLGLGVLPPAFQPQREMREQPGLWRRRKGPNEGKT